MMALPEKIYKNLHLRNDMFPGCSFFIYRINLAGQIKIRRYSNKIYKNEI